MEYRDTVVCKLPFYMWSSELGTVNASRGTSPPNNVSLFQQ